MTLKLGTLTAYSGTIGAYWGLRGLLHDKSWNDIYMYAAILK